MKKTTQITDLRQLMPDFVYPTEPALCKCFCTVAPAIPMGKKTKMDEPESNPDRRPTVHLSFG